ncbi:MAG: hypothetical protein CMJ76_08095 [Planctomycetaceae bacterium]|nr:hypothetical protein [Planctomycetaceae bacterium]
MAAKRTSISRQQRRAERKHRKGLPEQTPTHRRETLDDVLAELDYEHIALGLEPESSSRDSKVHETPETADLAVKTEPSAEENPLAALGLLYDHLYPRNLRDKLQTILDKMAGLHYHSAAQNSPLVRKLKQIVNGAGFELVYAETGQVVRMRFIDPPRAKSGYFQLRTADAEQTAVYTGVTFPNLQVQPKINRLKPR